MQLMKTIIETKLDQLVIVKEHRANLQGVAVVKYGKYYLVIINEYVGRLPGVRWVHESNIEVI